MLRAAAMLTAFLLLAMPTLAGTATLDDPAGDVTVAPFLAGSGGALAMPTLTACDDPRVDITGLTTTTDAQNVVFTLDFAGTTGPHCAVAMAPTLTGNRGAQIVLGWWQDAAFLRVLDSSLRATGCFAFGEYRTATGLEQFEAPCLRSETPASITYTVGTFAPVTSAEAPDVDLRTLDFGRGHASAHETATDDSGTVGLRFHDSIPVPAGRLA